MEVPRDIYNPVMCMLLQASLELAKEQPAVSALWWRPTSARGPAGAERPDEPAQTEDLTRLPDFPRSIYFARSAVRTCAGWS